MQDLRELGRLAVQYAREGRWNEAIQTTHTVHRLAPAGSVLHLWALHHLACTYSDAGRPTRALPFARAYLREADAHPELERYTPFVVRHMGRIAYQQGRFLAAFTWHSKALAMFSRLGLASQVARSSLNMVWALVRAGRPAAARMVLPSPETFGLDQLHLYDGTMSAVLFAEGDFAGAIEYGKRALSCGSRLSHDFVDSAEVALILANALRRLGQDSEASQYIRRATEFAALQEWSAFALLALNERGKGGVAVDDTATVSRGSANSLHRGCFSSGVA